MASEALRRTNARNRSALSPSMPRRFTSAVISTIDTTAADTIQITFSRPVIPSRLPGFVAGAGGAETVSSMSKISDTVIEFVFTGDVQGTDMIVQEGDPGIRTVAGGFVPAGSYPVPVFP